MTFTSGLPETLCGRGSTLAQTEYLRPRLARLLRQLRVKRLLDAPCGDFNWMRHVDLEGIDYVGADSSQANLAKARTHSANMFIELDIISGELPAADAMLCRDFHQHLPHRMVIAALINFVAADIPWLLATTFDTTKINKDITEAGQFRRISLMLPPFNFPYPGVVIADPPISGHFLGVWSRSDVARAVA